MPRIAFRLVLVAFAALATAPTPARAQEPAPAAEESSEPGSLTEVNKKLTNPVSDLWSLTFQANHFLVSPGPGEPDRWSTNLLFQPVLPLALTSEWNWITRPVIPLYVSQPHPDPSDPRELERTTTFGDVTLLQLLSPSPKLAGNWLLGAGPSWIFPTANSDFTGQGKYQVGPAALVGYLSQRWIAGALVQNWWSFAGSGDRSVAQMNLQPFASWFLPDGWSVGYSGNLLANWKADGGNAYTVPLGIALGKVVRVGPLPVRFQLAGQWIPIQPDRFGAKWNLQLVVTPVIPKLVQGTLLGD